MVSTRSSDAAWLPRTTFVRAPPPIYRRRRRGPYIRDAPTSTSPYERAVERGAGRTEAAANSCTLPRVLPRGHDFETCFLEFLSDGRCVSIRALNFPGAEKRLKHSYIHRSAYADTRPICVCVCVFFFLPDGRGNRSIVAIYLRTIGNLTQTAPQGVSLNNNRRHKPLDRSISTLLSFSSFLHTLFPRYAGNILNNDEPVSDLWLLDPYVRATTPMRPIPPRRQTVLTENRPPSY